MIPADSLILVSRCDHEPAIPSSVVTCATCGADCWLSVYSGPSTIALASKLGIPRFCCVNCYDLELREGSR